MKFGKWVLAVSLPLVLATCGESDRADTAERIENFTRGKGFTLDPRPSSPTLTQTETTETIALHKAAVEGNAALAKQLLDEGASPDVKDAIGQSPLHFAANAAVAELLLDAGANPNAEDINGTTPLHWAVDAAAIAELLLDAGANPNAGNNDGYTPLHEAPINAAVAELLLDTGANPNAGNNDGDTPLHEAATNGNAAVAELLLDAGASPNAGNNDGYTPLHDAARSAVAELLLDAGANPNAENRNGETPLHFSKTEAVAKLLLDAGANPNAESRNGETPLHWAAQRGADGVAKQLLNKGANPNARDNDGNTPLDWAEGFASRNEKEKMVNMLLDKGAKPELTRAAESTRQDADAEAGLSFSPGGFSEPDAGEIVERRTADSAPPSLAAADRDGEFPEEKCLDSGIFNVGDPQETGPEAGGSCWLAAHLETEGDHLAWLPEVRLEELLGFYEWWEDTGKRRWFPMSMYPGGEEAFRRDSRWTPECYNPEYHERYCQ